MKSIKSLDLFEKITVDNVVKPTYIGGFISLSTIVLVVYLIIQETCNYLTPNIKKDAIVYHDSKNTNQLNVHFKIKLLTVPCPIISVDREDLIGTHIMDIKENLQKIRLDKENNQIMDNYTPYKLELLEKSLKDKESCFIKGFIPVNKAPGDIHISFHNFRDVWDHFKENKKDLFKNLNVDHQIFSFKFDDEEMNEIISSKFGEDSINSASFTSWHEIKNKKSSSEENLNYDYYLKLIPHLYRDEINDTEYLTYHHSLTYKSKKVESDNEMPLIMINFDFSPITMKITLQQKSFPQFLIHICAIVGGIFVIFSIINRVLIVLLEDCLRSKKKNYD